VGSHSKLPTKSLLTEHILHEDDIVVMASDGIWDNLYNDDVQVCVNSQLSKTKSDSSLGNLQAVSDCISTLAEAKGYDTKYESPFSKEAKAHGKDLPGGKADDITVIVS